jgi:ankyrin repeat protein
MATVLEVEFIKALHLLDGRSVKEVANWLINNSSADNEQVFQFACCSDYANLALAKCLLQMKPDIDISAHNHVAFRGACEKGRLDIAKWLLQMKPNMDISDFNNGFYWACSEGHLEVAQWLLKKKPNINISANDEIIFRLACYHGHLAVVKWLLKVNPNIGISFDNEYIDNVKENFVEFMNVL